MTYEWDWQAREGAAAHAVSGHDVDALRDLCARKAGGLGQGGVRGHSVGFSVTAWDEPPGLPDGISRTGCITCGDVLDIGQQVRAGARPAVDLLTASFIWGSGTAGCGPRRLRRIRSQAGDRLEPALRRVLDAVSKDATAPDPVAGYACMYGGQASQDRAVPGQEQVAQPAARALPGVLHQVPVLLHARGADPRQQAGRRRQPAEPPARPRHRQRLPAGLDALPLRGLPALYEPDRPGRASGAGTPGNHPFQATDA